MLYLRVLFFFIEKFDKIKKIIIIMIFMLL